MGSKAEGDDDGGSGQMADGTEVDPQVASASMTWANCTGHTGLGWQKAEGRLGTDDDGGSRQKGRKGTTTTRPLLPFCLLPFCPRLRPPLPFCP